MEKGNSTRKTFADKTEEAARLVDRLMAEKRQAVFQRFPLLFTLLVAIGFVATFYGFERVMDQTGLSNNPLLLLGIGIAILVFTGTLYKKLGS